MATPVVQEVYTYQLTGNTTTISHPVRDGANRYMLIDLPGRYASLTSATYGGTAVPAIPGADAGAGTAGTAHRHVNAAALVAPPVGTASLVIVVSGNNQGTVRVRNMVDVDQSTPLRSQGGGNYAVSSSGTSSTGDTLSVAAQAGDLVMDLIAVSTTATMGAGQTRTGYGTQPSNQYASAKVATGASESMGWTYSSGTFAHLGLAVIGAAATQPDPADYSGARGTRSWHVAARLAGEEVTAGSTFYGSLSASPETSTAESTLVRTLMREAGELSRLTCGILTNATTSASTLTLLEGGVSTGITITIPAGATGLFEAAGAHTLSGSTALGWSLANGGGGSIYINRLTWAFEAASGDTVTHLSAFSSSSWDVPSNTTAYMSAQGSRLSGSTVESYAAMRVPMDATWRGLHVIANNREDVTVVSRINGNNGNQTLSWATAGGIWNPQEDTTHSDAIVDGDLIDWRVITGTLGAVWQNERWSSRLISTASEFLLAARAGPSSTGVALSDGVWYAPVSGELSLSSTEADAQAPAPFDMASKRLAVHVTSNTSLLPCKVSLRINGADASQRIEIQPGIAGVFYADVWGVDDIDTDDLVCIKLDHAGVTNTIRVESVSLVGIERVAAATTHATSGSLAAQASSLAGAALHPHTSSGALAAQAATVAGNAVHPHLASGTIAAQASGVTGAAAHQHAGAGVLASDAAGVSGVADRSSAGAFDASGSLSAQAAMVIGAAQRIAAHATAGSLASGPASIAGAAAHLALHTSEGALAAGPATFAGVAVHSSGGGATDPAAVWAFVLSNGKTAEQTLLENNEMLRVILAGISGTTSGIGTSTETYYGTDGTTPRIVATFDAQGNRTSVAIDGAP